MKKKFILKVSQAEIDTNYTLKELQDFSRHLECIIIVKKYCRINDGIIDYLI